MTECIARVDPGSGRVVGWVLLHGLRDGMLRETAWGKADVLNGVAWDAQRKRLFVTARSLPTPALPSSLAARALSCPRPRARAQRPQLRTCDMNRLSLPL